MHWLAGVIVLIQASIFADSTFAQTGTKFRRTERSFTIDPSQNMDIPSNLDCRSPTGRRLNGHTIPSSGNAAQPGCAPLYDVLNGMTAGGQRRCASDHVIKGFNISGNRLDFTCN